MAHVHAITIADTRNTSGGYPLPLLARFAVQFAAIVTTWDMKRRTRRQLLKLDDRLLHDVGIERDAAYTEARRPFWL